MYVICTLVGKRSKNVVHELVGEQKKRGQFKETYEEPLVGGACGHFKHCVWTPLLVEFDVIVQNRATSVGCL